MTRIPASNLRAANLELGDDEVHIWWADLDKACDDLEAFQLTLSEDERVRAERFRFERDRNRFIGARGTLREILGNYLAIKPHTIQFDYGKNGKPRLAGKFAKNHIEFNVSHSEGIALYGFCCDQEIGVDVERIIEVPEMEEIAKHYFTNKESKALFKLPSGEKLHSFFRCWTLKEAYLKAIGQGFVFPLQSFDVSLKTGDPARLLKVQGDAKEASGWSVETLVPQEGFTAAVVARGGGLQMFHGQWPREPIARQLMA